MFPRKLRSTGKFRRRPHTGPVAPRYFRTRKIENSGIYLRSRERAFAELFVEGFLHIAPVLFAASKSRSAIVLRKLGMDAVEKSPYRCRTEKALSRQAIYLMNMPRVQDEIDRILSRKWMSTERMAARLAEIMEGKATIETRKYTCDKNGKEILSERVITQNSVGDSLRAIDMTLKIKGQYAPTNAKVTINNDMGKMFDQQTFDVTPEIRIDPDIALESAEHALPEMDDTDMEDDDEEDEYCDTCEAAGKEECDCEYDEDDE